MTRMTKTCGLLATAALFATAADTAAAAPARLVRAADASTPAQQAFMNARFWRLRSATSLGWSANTWVTQHAFGLDPADAAAHPEWRLLDNTSQPVYVGSRVAADVGNAAFRTWWIAKAQAAVALGHRGLIVDDVFMERRFTTLAGASRTPIDPRTGVSMTEANWQRQMADFMVAVRAALPSTEIVHDVLWYKGDAGDVLRELQAANAVSLDKGFNDASVVSGSSTYGYATLAGWLEREQARGGSVVLDSTSTGTTAAARVYGLAGYLLVNNGLSAIANDGATGPDSFWPGYDADLGAPLGARYSWSNVWRRDYAGGIVLVNEPYRSTRTLTIPDGYKDLDGVARTSVTLTGGSGIVLVPIPPVPTPTPTPEPPVETSIPVAPNPPAGPATPTAPRTPTSTGTKARVSAVGHVAGARAPSKTSTSVRGSAARLSGTVKGAVAGQVRLTVERRRGGRWVLARRVAATVKRSGSFYKDIPRLSHGTYRLRGSFLGTGTSRPSKSASRGFHA